MHSSIILLLLLPSSISSLATTDNSSSSFAHTTTSNSTARPTSSRSHSLVIPSRPPAPSDGPIRGPGRFPPHPTRTVPIGPTATDDWQQPRHKRTSGKPIAVFFEVLGGLIGLAVVISCLRCCYIYKRTPGRDRIAAVLHRHQLEQELAELERNGPLTLRRSPTGDPVPPYFPPPPTYEAITSMNSTSTTSTTTPLQRSGYVEVATSSPPSSPSLPTRQLESVEPTSPISRPPVPPAPNG